MVYHQTKEKRDAELGFVSEPLSQVCKAISYPYSSILNAEANLPCLQRQGQAQYKN
jgi:hypothetical protein